MTPDAAGLAIEDHGQVNTICGARYFPSRPLGRLIGGLLAAAVALIGLTYVAGQTALAAETSLEASTSVIDFGDVPIGTIGTQQILFTNTGSEPIGPLSTGPSIGFSPHFNAGGNLCSGEVLAPGQSCTFEVYFPAQTLGAASASATLAFGPDDNTLKEFTFQVHANAVEANGQPLSADASALDFGDVAVGDSRTLGVKFTNTGAAPYGPIVVAGGVADNAVFSVDMSDCSGATLQPTWSCQITYTFSPLAPGLFTAAALPALTLDEATGREFPLALSGTGTESDETASTVPEDTAPPTTDPTCSSHELVAPGTTTSTTTTVATSDTAGDLAESTTSTTVAVGIAEPTADDSTLDDTTATESSDVETVETDVAGAVLEEPVITDANVDDESIVESHGFGAGRWVVAAVCAPVDDDPTESTIPVATSATDPDVKTDGGTAGGSGGGAMLPATR